MAVAEQISTPNVEEKHVLSQTDFPEPEAVLGSGWLEESSQAGKDCFVSNDAIATLLDQDFCKDTKMVPAGASSNPLQGFGLESYPWNKMPDACQMPELP